MITGYFAVATWSNGGSALFWSAYVLCPNHHRVGALSPRLLERVWKWLGVAAGTRSTGPVLLGSEAHCGARAVLMGQPTSCSETSLRKIVVGRRSTRAESTASISSIIASCRLLDLVELATDPEPAAAFEGISELFVSRLGEESGHVC